MEVAVTVNGPPAVSAVKRPVLMSIMPPPDTVHSTVVAKGWPNWSSPAAVKVCVSPTVTVADAGGDPVWRTETRDTAVVLPPDVSLEPGARYVWFVDALLPDGGSATSGVHRFEIASSDPER